MHTATVNSANSLHNSFAHSPVSHTYLSITRIRAGSRLRTAGRQPKPASPRAAVRRPGDARARDVQPRHHPSSPRAPSPSGRTPLRTHTHGASGPIPSAPHHHQSQHPSTSSSYTTFRSSRGIHPCIRIRARGIQIVQHQSHRLCARAACCAAQISSPISACMHACIQ